MADSRRRTVSGKAERAGLSPGTPAGSAKRKLNLTIMATRSHKTSAIFARAFYFIFFLALFACGRSKKPAIDRPNVILIVLDGAPADLFGVYGYDRRTTPRIDEIARQGAVFLNHFTSGIRTRDAVPIMMFSSYHPVDLFEVRREDLEWGIRGLAPESVFQGRPEQLISLPELMAQSGWSTAIFSNILYLGEIERIKELFGEVYDLPFPTSDQPRDEALVSALLNWLRERDDNLPFFAYYHILSPHRPFPVKEEDDYFLAGFEKEFVDTVRQKLWGECVGIEKDIARGLYKGNLKHSDRWVGVLFDELDEMKLLENTIIIVTSDHGTHYWQGWDYWYKVPMIIHYPSKVPAGAKSEAITDTTDIMPTILALTGLDAPAGKKLIGNNLLEIIEGKAEGKEKVYIHDIAARDRQYVYYRRDDAKEVFRRRSGEEALFDLTVDQTKKTNLITEQPEIAARLASFLEEIRSSPLPYSRRRQPPKFPFFFSFNHFPARPAGLIRHIDETVEEGFSWQLIGPDGSLVRSPGIASEPLELSTSIPNGAYRISLLLETVEHISLNPSELGLRSRFGPKEEYRVPESVEFFGNSPEGRPRYYIDLGGTAVTGESFSLGIDHQLGGEDLHYFRHVKFVPDKIREPIVHRWEDDITLALRVIGYLDYDDRAPVTVFRPTSIPEIDSTANLLLDDGVTLTASSYNRDSQTAAALLDDDPDTFWHIDENKLGEPAWVKVDLGEGNAAAVTAVAARPRTDFSFQFFRNAALQASPDGVNWTTLAQIVQEDEPDVGYWSYCSVENDDAYRYYRLLIIDGHQGERRQFWSIGDLAFFE